MARPALAAVAHAVLVAIIAGAPLQDACPTDTLEPCSTELLQVKLVIEQAMPESILFVKTHRTGSSTLTNILQRLGEKRHMLFLLPSDLHHLGWPSMFPGIETETMVGPPEHQYEVICNHAVFNDEKMRSYLKPHAFAFTVLRSPLDQIRSALDHYQDNPGWMWGLPETNRSSWDERIRFLRLLQETPHKFSSEDLGRYRNPQAHDLGYYEFSQLQIASWDVQSWVAGLSRNLSYVMLTEYYNEGLVLLRHKLDLAIEDIVYIVKNAAGSRGSSFEPVPPVTVSQDAELRALLEADIALYEHFNRTFWAEWEKAGGYAKLGAELDQLKAAHSAMEVACAQGAESCSWRFRASSEYYAEHLMQIQPTGLQNMTQAASTRRLLSPRKFGLTFKHLAKAGGTFIQQVLEAVIPGDLLLIRNETQSLHPSVTEGRFVLGSVRNPFDWYPSIWAHMMCDKCEWGQSCYMAALPADERMTVVPAHRDPPYDTPGDIARFRRFLNITSARDMNVLSLRFWAGFVRGREESGGHVHIADRSTPKVYIDEEMTDAERKQVFEEMAAYDPNNSSVSCWIKVESLQEDLVRCLQLYDQQGGTVHWDMLAAAMASSTHYESEHGLCGIYYDAETRALVQHGDSTIFDSFGYARHCSDEDSASPLNSISQLGAFHLVSGCEGSGTTMLTKVLCHDENVFCIPTNWRLSELSPAAQKKYLDAGLSEEMLDVDWMAIEHGQEESPKGIGQEIVAFNAAMKELWHDVKGRPYIQHGKDLRDPSKKMHYVRKAATAAQALLTAARRCNITSIVYHRSMPFDSRDSERAHSPFAADLPAIARLISPQWHARATLVLRDQPMTWQSHNSPGDYASFVNQIERLLARSERAELPAIPSVQFVAYSQLLCRPQEALLRLADGHDQAWPSRILSSPEFGRTVQQEGLSTQLAELRAFRQSWEKESYRYPLFTDFIKENQDCCTCSWPWWIVYVAITLFVLCLVVVVKSAALRFKLQLLSFLDVFIVHLQYSAAVPMAYDISLKHGKSATFSGFLIGSYWACVVFGALLVGKPFVSNASQPVQRQAALVSLAVMAGCSYAYAIAADPPAFWAGYHESLTNLLVASRMCAGFAWSIFTMVVSCMAVKVTPASEQVKNEGIRSFCITFGIALGPFLASGITVLPNAVKEIDIAGQQAAFPFWIVGVTQISVLVYAYFVIPSNVAWRDAVASESPGRLVAADTEMCSCKLDVVRAWQRTIWWAGNAYGIERALLTSSLEAASSLILQTFFLWSVSHVGQATGCTFLVAAVFILGCTLCLRPTIGQGLVMQAGSFGCAGAAFLLYFSISSSPLVVLLADLLVFSCGFVASSVAEGMVMQCSVPGTMCSVENAWLIRNVFKCSVSRFLGPIVARASISAGGVGLYAGIQLSLGCLSLILCSVLAHASKMIEAERVLCCKHSPENIAGFPAEEARCQYRVALCGLGKVADLYLQQIRGCCAKHFVLVACADPDRSTWSKIPKGIPVAESADGLIPHRPDVIIICVPSRLHTQVASQIASAKAIQACSSVRCDDEGIPSLPAGARLQLQPSNSS
ncbi:unnamed protein product [Effrenium voratum]|uniref:Gfo/Idh/MocA-like oxidoreductase N-terminal domain-containing protein n=1 Tax=Effrenium voratum TaxID=2562239 RepID=A0AA36N151_9DINO|nr:unnamed protein product [Effrenium voratum]